MREFDRWWNDYLKRTNGSLGPRLVVAQAAWEAALAAGEPVEWQYQDRQGEWHNFINDHHRDSTIDSGAWPIRALYAAAPPSKSLLPNGWNLS